MTKGDNSDPYGRRTHAPHRIGADRDHHRRPPASVGAAPTTDPPKKPDSGPEVIDFVPAGQSPTGRPLIAVPNETSGTVSLWSTGM